MAISIDKIKEIDKKFDLNKDLIFSADDMIKRIKDKEKGIIIIDECNKFTSDGLIEQIRIIGIMIAGYTQRIRNLKELHKQLLEKLSEK